MNREKCNCVVLADSHQNVLERVRGLLETMFEVVVMVADRKSLFQTVDRVKPDMAIIDLSLKPSDEVDVTRQFKHRYPNVKFIALSTHDDPSVARHAIASGASAFVLKRCLSTDIFDAIETVAEGRTFVSPQVNVRQDRGA